MRSLKTTFFKIFRSNLLWCGVIFVGKIYVHLLQLLSKWHIPGFHTPIVWTRPTRARTNNDLYKKLYDANIIPYRDTPTPIKQFQLYANEQSYEQFVCMIEQGTILGTDTSITPDYKILRDSNGYLGQTIYGNPYVYKRTLPTPEKIGGTIALIAGNDTEKNYNHRMTFGLPKLHLFQKSGYPIDGYATNYAKPFHQESFAAAGISPSQIIPLEEKKSLQVEYLLIASTTTICGNMPQWAIQYVRGLFLHDMSHLKGPKKRLYIQRTQSRKIANEEELMHILKKYHFETVVLDTMSVSAQAQLFQSAEVVFGPHGAGFTNLMFCDPGTHVIECFQPKTIRGHYYCLSHACGLTHTALIGEEIPDKQTLPMDRDMFIESEKLATTLQKLFPHG